MTTEPKEYGLTKDHRILDLARVVQDGHFHLYDKYSMRYLCESKDIVKESSSLAELCDFVVYKIKDGGVISTNASEELIVGVRISLEEHGLEWAKLGILTKSGITFAAELTIDGIAAKDE